MKRALVLFSTLLIGAATAAPVHEVVSARAISLLSARERQALPDSTPVTVHGRQVTLGAIRAVHALRMKFFANASILGLKWKASVHLPPGFALTQAIPIPQSILQNYAKDYQDFCKAAAATACIYLPVIGSWESGAHNTSLSATTQDVTDPLITDGSVCSAGGGHLTSDGCVYTYPVKQTTNFPPLTAGKYTTNINCPLDKDAKQGGFTTEWNAGVDPHGAAFANWAINYTWPYWLEQGIPEYDASAGPATCVVQVFAQ
ncbi:MAG TPA: hypothetical protein VMU08_03545 [Rhizomicrobium sp.]|nr:hypothetical protein [Rhizomicrobium sp.]